MSAGLGLNTIRYTLGSAELLRENLSRSRVAALESSTDLRELDADATKLNEVVRAPSKFNRGGTEAHQSVH